MPTTKFKTYNNFTGGDWGELGEFRAPEGTFTGVNVLVYENGLIGPRSGLHENTYTGTTPNGKCWGIWHIGQIGRPLMISVGDGLYSSSLDNEFLGTVALENTLDAEPTYPLVVTWYDPNGDVYMTSPQDKCYYMNMTTDVLSPLPVRNGGADDAGVETIYLSKDRLYAAGDGHQVGGNGGQFVYCSAPADFTNFAGGETFQVGYYNSVRAITESQNSLLFSTLESTNNLGSGVGWYSLTGATPQGSLYRVNTQVATLYQSEVVAAEGGNVYFWSGWTTANEDNPYLVCTNGAKFDDQTYKHIRLGSDHRFGYYNNPDQTLIYTDGLANRAWIRANGAWTQHEFEVPITGPVAPTARGDSFLLPFGETGEDLVVYEMFSRPSTPPFPNVASMPGDNSLTPFQANFQLPAFVGEKESRIRRVIVNFKKWNTGHDVTTNKFVVGIRTWGQYNLPGGSTDGEYVTAGTWEEAQTEATSAAAGTLDRFVARVAQQGKSASFQIGISDIRGVAIESITVEYDVDDEVEGRTR